MDAKDNRRAVFGTSTEVQRASVKIPANPLSPEQMDLESQERSASSRRGRLEKEKSIPEWSAGEKEEE
ncbi:hypothetical protein EOD39_5567 [Acipenser ruthenus]|uniref:Uncharacterized protein n=1 Tax=Acipenser ruthenus TaxID=7906 RepID=A0A444UDW7_ACIRT|nr:hypothetical protein EOD39_5567 [Acipenser ruthenus]